MTLADNKTPEERSRNMSAIHAKNTKPEMFLRKLLFSMGYRYRIAPSNIIGKHDIYLSKYHTAIFVNGCFWHRHEGCKYAYTPKSRVNFWLNKFEKNKQRDVNVRKVLIDTNIRCLQIWECTIKHMRNDPIFKSKILDEISLFLCSRNDYMEL